MAVIFALSAQPDLSSGPGVFGVVLRKLVHMGEYAALWFLWHRALRYRHLGLAVAITIAYAGTDELHQSFVEGRHGTPVDVAIDAVGVAAAVALWRRSRRDAA